MFDPLGRWIWRPLPGWDKDPTNHSAIQFVELRDLIDFLTLKSTSH